MAVWNPTRGFGFIQPSDGTDEEIDAKKDEDGDEEDEEDDEDDEEDEEGDEEVASINGGFLAKFCTPTQVLDAKP